MGACQDFCVKRHTLPARARKRFGQERPPPGNRLEALKDDRLGQHSIRIND